MQISDALRKVRGIEEKGYKNLKIKSHVFWYGEFV